jgi:hypothetical protein
MGLYSGSGVPPCALANPRRSGALRDRVGVVDPAIAWIDLDRGPGVALLVAAGYLAAEPHTPALDGRALADPDRRAAANDRDDRMGVA